MVKKVEKRVQEVSKLNTIDEFYRMSTLIEEATKGKIIIQSSKKIDELYLAAQKANKELKRITETFAKETNGKQGIRPETVNNGLKSRERAFEKIEADYNGDASKLLDIAGSKVVYETVEELYSALEKFSKHFQILKFKDRIRKPLLNGYRDILMNIKMSNGHIIEFRLHLRTMDEAAEKTHALYEKYRSLEAISKTRTLSDKEVLKMIELDKKATEIHNQDWNKLNKIN